ncbi:oxygen-independent coproporphyrinogen-3 oxidase [Lacibacter cauensis]|uniref:Heme chaperone HemW n=1 Tax=Lacibacter cauensis TaxID=510947 RepID=A0A562SQX1_9BACT|nr:radical SAM family heme chaperone HemW [Lacibacter cauensis]TWI83414.1 oxygen-independent coproporphyrinogen-3 oxidase [Lacibacter cauensis]
MMAGIYIHIPFCRQACNYCNFHFSTSLHYKNDFVAALLNEIQLQAAANYLQDQSIATIYFGGGTPSLLTVEELQQIMQALQQHFTVTADAEITLEANPDDVTDEKLVGWKTLGINRLSIGIQSLFEEDLQWMNRAHTAEEAKQVITKARAAGFNSFTVDLIYGTPGLTDEKWLSNINWVLQQNINHLSCYALTVEEKTPLDKLIRQHKKTDVDAEQQSRQFILLMNELQKAGFEHYEISNFAKPGYRSKHNSSYWKGVHYLGLGPSAHSFNGISRQWNVANNQQYIQALQQHTIPFEKEELTKEQQLNEYIMTSLRLMEGCDLHYVEQRFGIAAANRIRTEAVAFVSKGLLTAANDHLILTQPGKLFADSIAADLFA